MSATGFPRSRIPLHRGQPAALQSLGLLAAGSGLVVGRNRQEKPVALRLFRSEPTRLALIGGVRCAQLLTLRTVALGAQIYLQTAREQEWDAFLRRSVIGRETASFLPPNTPPPTPVSPTQQQLVVVDTGPSTGAGGGLDAPWRVILTVRDDLGPWDAEMLTKADAVLFQRLTEPEAALAASTLGLVEAQSWLTKIHPEMVGLVSRERLQWVMLTMTGTERSLIGSASRNG